DAVQGAAGGNVQPAVRNDRRTLHQSFLQTHLVDLFDSLFGRLEDPRYAAGFGTEDLAIGINGACENRSAQFLLADVAARLRIDDKQRSAVVGGVQAV